MFRFGYHTIRFFKLHLKMTTQNGHDRRKYTCNTGKLFLWKTCVFELRIQIRIFCKTFVFVCPCLRGIKRLSFETGSIEPELHLLENVSLQSRTCPKCL